MSKFEELLDIVTESTRYTREGNKALEEIKRKEEEINKKIEKLKKVKQTSGSDKIKSEVDSKIINNKNQLNSLKEKFKKTYSDLGVGVIVQDDGDDFRSSNSIGKDLYTDRSFRGYKTRLQFGKDYKKGDPKYNITNSGLRLNMPGVTGSQAAGKSLKEPEKRFGRFKNDYESRKPGTYAKESVTELKLEIYESCRYGEITEEERDFLLESL